MVLSEAGSLDRLFRRVEERIGLSIESIVVEAKAASTRHYWENMLPEWKRRVALHLGFEKLVERLYQQGRIMGYGDIRFEEIRMVKGRPDYLSLLLKDPYSLPLFIGDFKGVCEVVGGVRVSVEHEELEEGWIRLKATNTLLPAEEPERLDVRYYPRKPGNVILPRCRRCQVPLALSSLEWDLEAGTIIDKASGRRMALFGPGGVNSVFRELEGELGPEMPQLIVEAEKQNTLERALRAEALLGPEGFREVTALRGLGNLTAYDTEGWRLSVRIENPAFPLLATGLAWGLYEIALGGPASCEWGVREDGDLWMKLDPLP